MKTKELRNDRRGYMLCKARVANAAQPCKYVYACRVCMCSGTSERVNV